MGSNPILPAMKPVNELAKEYSDDPTAQLAYMRGWMAARNGEGVTALLLDEYERVNLLWLLDMVMKKHPELHTGDWTGMLHGRLGPREVTIEYTMAPNKPWPEDDTTREPL